ncbi:MAG: hypothetical protein KF791_00785 [Verrucomicrobiae bacterium]|nr:hypothetical protein [Verrucomicrobiae bacterium]
MARIEWDVFGRAMDFAEPPGSGAVMVGLFQTPGGSQRPSRLAGLLPNGTVDPQFNWRASLEFPIPDSEVPEGVRNHVRVLPDGRLVVAGGFVTANGEPRVGFARFDSRGFLDATFDPGWHLGLPVVAGQPAADVRLLTLQSDGQFLTAFSIPIPGQGVRHWFVRVRTDGTVDDRFRPPAGLESTVESLGVLPDGSLLAAGGYAPTGAMGGGSLVRLNSDGTLDNGFLPELPGTRPRLEAIQADGRALVTVDAVSSGGMAIRRLLRLEGYTGPAVAPEVIIPQASWKAAPGESVVLRAVVHGWPPPSLQWQHDGVALPGEVSPVLRLASLPMESAGTYRRIAWNAAGTNGAEASLSLGVRSPPAGRLLPTRFCSDDPPRVSPRLAAPAGRRPVGGRQCAARTSRSGRRRNHHAPSVSPGWLSRSAVSESARNRIHPPAGAG